MGVICMNSFNNVFSDDDFDQLQESEDDDECVEEGQQPKAHWLLRESILYAVRFSFKRKQLERPAKKSWKTLLIVKLIGKRVSMKLLKARLLNLWWPEGRWS